MRAGRDFSVMIPVLFVVLLVCGSAAAQNAATVEGILTVTVVDESGGRVPNATVTLLQGESERVAATDSTGTTENRLTVGEWSLQVSAPGFATTEQVVNIGSAPVSLTVTLGLPAVGQTVSVQGFALPEPVQLRATATGGTKLNIPVRELPASLSIVTQELIEERGAWSGTEAVELAVGMISHMGVGSIPSYSTRGFSGNSVSIMRDGIRQNTASQSSRPIDTFVLDRVEVLRGPASVLYGEGAIGAAINYVSKEPQPFFGGEALLTYGRFGTARAGVGVNVPLSDTLLTRLDVSHSTTDGYADRSDQALDAFAGTVLWAPNEAFSLKASGTYTDDNTLSYYGTPFIDGEIDPRTRFLNYNMRDNFARSHNSWGRLDATYRTSGGWTFNNEFFVATHRLDWRNMEGYAYNDSTGLVDVTTYFLIWRNDVLLGDRFDVQRSASLFGKPLDLNLGVEHQRNDLEREGLSDRSVRFSVDPFDPEPIFDPQLDYEPQRDVVINTTALYGESLLEVTDRLKLVTGLRWERIALDFTDTSLSTLETSSRSFRPFTGRAGLVFEIAPEVNVYGSYSRAVEPTTQLVSLSGSRQLFSLTPGRQWEFGTKATLANGRLDATLAYFDIEKRDILISSLINGVRTNQQVGRQVSRGVELSMVGQPTVFLTLWGNLALTDAEFADFTEIVDGVNVSRDGNTPSRVPTTIASFTPTVSLGRFTLGSTIRHVSDRFGDNANTRRVGSYTTLDASVSYQLQENYRLTLQGRNLTDEIYTPGTSSATYIRLAAPRSVDLTLRATF